MRPGLLHREQRSVQIDPAGERTATSPVPNIGYRVGLLRFDLTGSTIGDLRGAPWPYTPRILPTALSFDIQGMRP